MFRSRREITWIAVVSLAAIIIIGSGKADAKGPGITVYNPDCKCIMLLGEAGAKEPTDLTCTADECASEKFAGSSCYMGECFDQWIIRTTKLSNGTLQVFVKIRPYNSSDPKVALGLPEYATNWVLCRSQRGYVQDEKHIRIEEPNPQASHATEPAENLWAAVCNINKGTR
jgi:hypothetical protein